jgi:hypothetical protein
MKLYQELEKVRRREKKNPECPETFLLKPLGAAPAQICRAVQGKQVMRLLWLRAFRRLWLWQQPPPF